MKRPNKSSISNRLNSMKENQHYKHISQTQQYLQKTEQPIESWKDGPQRIILTDTTNTHTPYKYAIPSRSRLSTVQSVKEINEDDHANGNNKNKRLSEIEILKRQAMYLDTETIQERRAISPQFTKTQPTTITEMTSIKIDNWLTTSTNGFFRSQQRHATLEKKRHRIKKLRKIDILNMNGIIESNTRMFKQSILKEIQEINKPLILYPLMDVFYQEEIKYRLNTPMLKSKQNLKRQRYSTSEAKQSRDEKQGGEPIRIKTMNNWRSDTKSAPKKTDTVKSSNTNINKYKNHQFAIY